MCSLFDNHCWSLQTKEWKLTDINCLADFKRLSANCLICDFCGATATFSGIKSELTANEINTYSYQTLCLFTIRQFNYQEATRCK